MGKSPLLYQMMGVTSLQAKQVGRKSGSRGFKVEYRTDGDTLYVKKIGTIAAAGEPKKEKVVQRRIVIGSVQIYTVIDR